jgi:hypothetical protein
VNASEVLKGQLVTCQYCHAIKFGAVPHGDGGPCPLKMKVDEAYVSMLDAQRAAYLRQGVAMEDMSGAFGRITGADEE